MNEYVIYLVVRKDLKMGVGKIAAQCGHAVEFLSLKCSKEIMQEYVTSGHTKVVLKVPDEKDFSTLVEQCINYKVPFEVVVDAGRTQIAPNSATVVGIGPIRKMDAKTLVGGLKLL